VQTRKKSNDKEEVSHRNWHWWSIDNTNSTTD
jgi:hypothetical protein